MRRLALVLAGLATALLPAAAAAAPFEVAGPLRRVALRELASGLPAITAITHSNPPGQPHQLYLTLRDGRVVIWDGSRILPEPFLDLRPLVGTADEGGLLSLAFHLRFHFDGRFFVLYTDPAANIHLVRYRTLPGNPGRADPASAVPLLTLDPPFSTHNGGQLAFAANGYLYLSVGDGGSIGDPQCHAQRRDSLHGKILRLDVNRSEGCRPYAIPPDNPFRNGPFRPEVWAAGLRNPWRFSFDRATGDLWIGDVGQDEREEIDVQPALQGGVNWGWKPMEGSLCYRANRCPSYVPACDSPAFAAPLLEYAHDETTCAVTGGFVYRGQAAPDLVGTYLFGDFCSGQIWGAARTGSGLVVRELPKRARLLTTFGEDQAGEVYVGTADGRLLVLEPTPPVDRVGLYNPQRAQFLLKEVNEPGQPEIRFGFGRPRSGWLPLAGDWDGDGRDTVGFYDPARGLFRLRNTLSPGLSDLLFAFGPPGGGWLPVVGDWDGDGRDGVGLYDPAAAVFHLKNALAAGPPDRTVPLGPPGAGWLPLAGSFDDVAGDEVGLYDPAGAALHLESPQSAGGERVELFGPPGSGWLPVAGDWDGDGLSGLGLYDPMRSVFHLSDLNGQPERTFQVGRGNQGWLPLAGTW